jgi:hypothetical protein
MKLLLMELVLTRVLRMELYGFQVRIHVKTQTSVEQVNSITHRVSSVITALTTVIHAQARVSAPNVAIIMK